MPEIEPAIKSFLIDEPLPDFKKYDYLLDNWINNLLNDNADCQTGIFVDNNYQSWADDDNKPDIKTDVFLPAVDDNVDGQTKIFVDDNYQSWADNIPDIKPKTDLVLEGISDADTIDYTSDAEFVKKVPQHPLDRLKRKIKRKIFKKKQCKNKKSKQKENI